MSGRGDPFDDLVETAGAASPGRPRDGRAPREAAGGRDERDGREEGDGRDERDGTLSDWPTLTDVVRRDLAPENAPRPGEDSSAVPAEDSFRGGDSSRTGIKRNDTEENVYVILPDQPDPGDDSSRNVNVGDITRPAPSTYAALARAPLAPLPAPPEEPPPEEEEDDGEAIPAAEPGFKKLVLRESDVAAKVAEAREAELAAVVERSARVRTPDDDESDRRRLKRLAIAALVLLLAAGTALGVRAFSKSKPAPQPPVVVAPPPPVAPAGRLTKDGVGTRIRRGLHFGLPNAVDAPPSTPPPGSPAAPGPGPGPGPGPAGSAARPEGGR